MTIRHDAQQCRAKASSDLIRRRLGLLTPAEREAEAVAEKRRQEAVAREAAKGPSLFGGPGHCPHGTSFEEWCPSCAREVPGYPANPVNPSELP
jgi:hypothetical protein